MEKSPTLHLGSIAINWLCGGNNQLDGGTMYGAVPKILWQKRYTPDVDNYIKLLNSPLLVRTKKANIIIDSGLGNKLTEKQQKIFRVYEDWDLVTDLNRHGLEREDIDFVIFTHGDFDHAGGLVMHNLAGEPELTFPRARHILQQREWEDISAPNIRATHTYFPKNFQGLAESGKLQCVDGDAEVTPGITVRLTGGHTRGHQLIEMQGSEGSAVHMGDVFPTHTHSNPLWVMAYDNFPLDVIERKLEYFNRYLRKDYWFTFYHDIHMRACRMDKEYKVIETFG